MRSKQTRSVAEIVAEIAERAKRCARDEDPLPLPPDDAPPPPTPWNETDTHKETE